MNLGIYPLLAVLFLSNTLIMFATYFVARAKNYYSLVDAVWAFCFVISALELAVLGSAPLARIILFTLTVGIWGVRLGTFLTRRLSSHYPHEDGRYVTLRATYAPQVERGFFWFYQFQSWSVVWLCIPFLIMASNSELEIAPLEWLGLGLWVLAISGEALADFQASQFKSNPENRGRVCQVGLWKYSRHPNYFFESLVWTSYFVMALGSQHGWIAVVAPLTILFLLLKVTGIPLAEKQSLQSRGDAYREYQRTTSAFIPWFRRASLVLLFVGATSSLCLAQPRLLQDRIAKIYAIDKTMEEPLFLQKTHYELLDKELGRYRETTTITDRVGKIAVSEVAEYSGTQLFSQVVDQYQTHNHYEVTVKDKTIAFSNHPITPEGEKADQVSRALEDRFLTGPISENFLAEHWSELEAGKTVHCRIGVLERNDVYGFKFWKASANVIKMKPSNFFLGLLLKPIELEFDPIQKRFKSYRGRTPLRVNLNGKLEPLDAEIIYDSGSKSAKSTSASTSAN